MRQLTVPDVLVQTAVTLVNLGSQKLAEEHDLDQVKSAIDATRALLPLLPEQVQGPVRDALSQLQLAFVRESRGTEEAAAGAEGQPPPADFAAPADPAPADPAAAPQPGDAQEPQEAAEEAERAKARAKIWTPPGT